ncbi:MAG TPA: hypothetical protein VH165_12595 [Kofleriaceae bacterium]|jgi:hypothetical protein|nr:hypothetical protein [Kofleriaceae bacterium]
MNVDDLVGALRATDGDDAELAEATRLRVRRSLETRSRIQHQLAGVLAAAGILFGGTVSWALATGDISALWSPAPQAIAPSPVAAPPAPPHRSSGPASISPPVTPPVAPPVTPAEPSDVPAAVPPAPIAPSPVAVAALPAPAQAPEAVPPVRAAAPRPVPMRPAAPPPVEALYRRAHELHFHGGDPVAALAAWDAYLAAEPAGRFSADARYDRAIALVRLGRYAEARAALIPFAEGKVEPAGYRQTEAEQLVARLAHAHAR